LSLFSFLVLVLGKAIQIWAQPLSVLGVSSNEMETQLPMNSQLIIFFLARANNLFLEEELII